MTLAIAPGFIAPTRNADKTTRGVYSRYAREQFGTLPDGRAVFQHRLTNCHGASVHLLDYGAAVASIRVPDGNGRLSDVVLGFDALDGYIADRQRIGVVLGHGAVNAVDSALFAAEPLEVTGAAAVRLQLLGSELDRAYPSLRALQMTYRFDDSMCLTVECSAEARRPFAVGVSQRIYFNLAGSGSILDHDLRVHAFEYAPILAPANRDDECRSVDGTPFDFRTKERVGSRVDCPDEQLRLAGGYAHSWVVAGTPGELQLAAELTCRSSGRRMTLRTTMPRLHFDSGNTLARDHAIRKAGRIFGWREGLSLEAQPAHDLSDPSLPSHPTLGAREEAQVTRYHSVTQYSFSRF